MAFRPRKLLIRSVVLLLILYILFKVFPFLSHQYQGNQSLLQAKSPDTHGSNKFNSSQYPAAVGSSKDKEEISKHPIDKIVRPSSSSTLPQSDAKIENKIQIKNEKKKEETLNDYHVSSTSKSLETDFSASKSKLNTTSIKQEKQKTTVIDSESVARALKVKNV